MDITVCLLSREYNWTKNPVYNKSSVENRSKKASPVILQNRLDWKMNLLTFILQILSFCCLPFLDSFSEWSFFILVTWHGESSKETRKTFIRVEEENVMRNGANSCSPPKDNMVASLVWFGTTQRENCTEEFQETVLYFMFLLPFFNNDALTPSANIFSEWVFS